MRRFPTLKRWIVIAGFVFVMPVAAIAQTTLDFENLPAGTTINDQYVRDGVRFTSAFLAADRFAHSGNRVLRSINPAAEVFNPIPLKIAFVQPQARIKLFAMSPGSARNGTLKVFDAAGAVIGQDGPKLVAADRFTTKFEVTLNGPRITRAELQLDGAAHFAIDDLEFDVKQVPIFQVNELRQPASKDNAAVKGTFPTEFRLGQPHERVSSKPSDPEANEEKFNMESVPAVVKELAPGASAQLVTRVTKGAGLAGTVRWIGTPSALPVTLSLNGSQLNAARTYALGNNRGGSDVGGVAKNAGEVKLVVKNTSNIKVKVSLTLGIVRTPVR